MTKAKLKIVDMHCTACALNIDFDLEDLPGVKSASTNYAKSETIVEFDETRVSLQAILSAIRKTGYTAVANVS